MLSVAIITHNEENNIRAALESVRWADEIVVVDSGSTDRTQEICREYTDKIYSFEWHGFSEQKNRAVSFTTQPWILVLDADERVTEELKKEILDIIKDKSSGDGYYLPRKNYFGERWIKHGGWWPDYTLRLFRRGRGSFEPREVHEAVKIDGPAAYFKNPLLHYTYKNTGDFFKRMETYSVLAAKELFKKGRRANIFDIIFRPPATFFRMFFFQLGILDGIYGIILAYLYSVYTYKKYSKLRKIESRK